jgi:hypothetical protein
MNLWLLFYAGLSVKQDQCRVSLDTHDPSRAGGACSLQNSRRFSGAVYRYLTTQVKLSYRIVPNDTQCCRKSRSRYIFCKIRGGASCVASNLQTAPCQYHQFELAVEYAVISCHCTCQPARGPTWPDITKLGPRFGLGSLGPVC